MISIWNFNLNANLGHDVHKTKTLLDDISHEESSFYTMENSHVLDGVSQAKNKIQDTLNMIAKKMSYLAMISPNHPIHNTFNTLQFVQMLHNWINNKRTVYNTLIDAMYKGTGGIEIL